MVRGLLEWLTKVGGGDVHWALSLFGGRNVCDIGQCVVRNKVWKVTKQIRDQEMGE